MSSAAAIPGLAAQVNYIWLGPNSTSSDRIGMASESQVS